MFRFANFLRISSLKTGCTRSLLSASYAQNEIWESRLKHPAFTVLSANDLGAQMMHKLESGQSVSMTDYDIYINKIHEVDITSLDFVERVMQRFCTTQESLSRLEATSHALVRAYIHQSAQYRLLNMLHNRMHFGVFLDPISTCLLVDHFLKSSDPASAATVVYERILQEDTSERPLTAILSLAALQRHWDGVMKTGEWPAQEEIADDEGEPTYVFVRYVRNPNYDDHFDVKEDRLLLGKSLHYLASSILPSLSLSPPPELLPSYRLLSLAMYEKFDLLLTTAMTLDTTPSAIITSDTIDHVNHLMNTASHRPEEESNKKGERQYYSKSEVDTIQAQVLTLMERWKSGNKTVTESLSSLTDGFVNQSLSSLQSKEERYVAQTYQQWMADRSSRIADQMAALHKQQVSTRVKRDLRSLMEREERLVALKDKHQIDYAAWMAPRTRQESRLTKRSQWRTDVENLSKEKARKKAEYGALEE